MNSVRVSSEWTNSTLGEIAVFVNGFGFSQNQWQDIGYPIVRIENMRDPVAAANCYAGTLPDRYRVNSGDILLSWSATLMALIWNHGPAWVNQHIFKVSPKRDIDRHFLYHLLSYVLVDLSAQTHGTTMKHIKRSDLLPFQVRIPPNVEQRGIAEILDTADYAIRSTERLIAKLEKANQGLLRDLLTRGIDESGSVRDPAACVDTQLGRRPSSWTALKVEDLLEGRPKNGYSPKEVDQWTGTLMLGLGCLTRTGFRPLQLKNAPTQDAGLKGAVLNDGDLLMSRANTRELVGLVGRFQDLGVPCTYPDLMMRLRPNRRVLPDYLEIALRAPSMRQCIQAAASGTSGSMVKISSGVLRNLLIAIPEIAEQRRIIRVLDGATVRIGAEERRLVKLRLVTGGVLVELLRGGVRVGALA